MNTAIIKPELLAPCGNREMMRAAVANGADAVYFGLDDFNARRRAENFTLEGLEEVVNYLHSRNVRAYVTLNTLIFSEELPRLPEYIQAIAQAGADAVIVQDLGVARLVRQMAPSLAIHASTQMTQTHPQGLAILRDLGISRVILARELTLDQIAKLAQCDAVTGGMELEVFVHGALCISYSGQCLASESLLGRSANRGQCGQPCRLPYQLLLDGQAPEDNIKEYPLSPQDLAAYDLVHQLCRLGVKGLKIEGRLKNSVYVAAVTQIYRAAIDDAVSTACSTPYAPTAIQRTQLDHTFSRRFTHGFMEDGANRQVVHGEFPSSRGIYLGHVSQARKQFVLLETDSLVSQPPVQPGDGVVFEASTQEGEIGGRVFGVEPYEDRRDGPRTTWRHFVLTFERQLDLSVIKTGSTVWKTDDPKMRKQIENSFSRDEVVRRAPLWAEVAGTAGGPLTVAMFDGYDRVEVAWPGPLQPAMQHMLTAQVAQEQLGRLGQSPFQLVEVKLMGPDGPVEQLPLMVPKSVLNDLRRQAVEALLQRRQASSHHEIVDASPLATLQANIAKPAQDALPSPQMSVLVRNLAQVQAVIDWLPAPGLAKPTLIYGEFQQTKDYTQAAELAKQSGIKFAPALPRIFRIGEEKTLEKIIAAGGDTFLVRNLAELEILRSRAGQVELVGDYSLNAANELTVDYLLGLGLSRIVPSYDLNWPQLEAMLPHCNPQSLEIVIHQHMPMFHTQHCLAAAATIGSDAADTGEGSTKSCGRPCRSHEMALQDRNQEHHVLLCDILCRNTVYNSFAQSAAQMFDSMLASGLRCFRVELLRETPQEAQLLLETYAHMLAGEDGLSVWRQLQARQSVTRGTWVLD